MGINVCLPHIHKSQIEIDYVDNEIYYGFTDIKGIGKGPAEFICRVRDEYKIESAEDLFAAIESEQKKWEQRKKELADEGVAIKEKSPKSTIPQNRISPLEEIGAFDDYVDRAVSLSQRQDFEKDLLGLILSDESEEILSDNYDIIEDLDDYSVLDEEEHAVVPGVVASIEIKKTRKSNKKMGIVTIEYQGQQLEFVVFPNDWKLYNFLWKERSAAIFSLKAGDRGIRFLDGQRLTKDKA
jgi:DNA polymerase III alpha subunit